MLKKIWHFLQANSSVIIIIELVVVISLIIKYLDVKLINETIIPIAYLVSVYFIYMAFKESQKSNVIETGKILFDSYSQEIKNLESWLENLTARQHEFKTKHASVKLESNKIFSMSRQISRAMRLLDCIPEYRGYIKKIKEFDSSLLEDGSMTLSTLINEYNTLFYIVSDYHGHMLRFLNIYEKIFNSKESIAREHITLLLDSLHIYVKDYSIICYGIESQMFPYEHTILISKNTTERYGDGIISKQVRLFSKLYDNDFTEAWLRMVEIEKELRSNNSK